MLLTRLTQRLSRQALQHRDATYWFWRLVTNGGRSSRALLRPRSHPDTATMGREIASRGIISAPYRQFLTSTGADALDTASAQLLAHSQSSAVQDIITGASGGSRKKEFLVDLVTYPDGMSPNDPLLKVALDEKLLEIVAGYLGMWPCLHSVAAWLNYATEAPPAFSQLWHRDPEDLMLIKVFIYLTDVGEHSGPFTYIPGTQPFGERNASAAELAQKKRVADKIMTRVFPKESWKICTGPKHTMILADTVGFHRGGKPETGQRMLITFTYTSAAPLTERALWLRELPEWASPIQRSAVVSLLQPPAPETRT